MTIAVISDIHGNYNALKAVLDSIAMQNVECIVSLGDIIGYGPEPQAAAQTIFDEGVVSILGNHELAAGNTQYAKRFNPTAQKSHSITCSLISQDLLNRLTKLPVVICRNNIRFVHGSPPKSPTAYLITTKQEKLAKIFSSFKEQVCFFGHTHTIDLIESGQEGPIRKKICIGQHQLLKQNRYLINPGSVGQPRDGISNCAKYAIWDQENFSVSFCEAFYNVEDTASKIRSLGFPDFNAQRLFQHAKKNTINRFRT